MPTVEIMDFVANTHKPALNPTEKHQFCSEWQSLMPKSPCTKEFIGCKEKSLSPPKSRLFFILNEIQLLFPHCGHPDQDFFLEGGGKQKNMEEHREYLGLPNRHEQWRQWYSLTQRSISGLTQRKSLIEDGFLAKPIPLLCTPCFLHKLPWVDVSTDVTSGMLFKVSLCTYSLTLQHGGCQQPIVHQIVILFFLVNSGQHAKPPSPQQGRPTHIHPAPEAATTLLPSTEPTFITLLPPIPQA